MRLLLCAALGLGLAPWAAAGEVVKGPAASALAVPLDPIDKPADKCHGTALEFFATPTEAAAAAKKEQKLVFVLHVSGNFEDPRFT